MSLYAAPSIGSAGLGNGLFPWARAEVFARAAQVPVIAPRWASLRIGPYLRQEPEKRHYGNFFASSEHVGGVRGIGVGMFARRFPEGQRESVYEAARRSLLPHVVVFRGLGAMFAPLLVEHGFIRRRLWDMTREPLRPLVDDGACTFIAMHVRRGDITRQGFAPGELDAVHQYTPLHWFVDIVAALSRAGVLQGTSVRVYSDGSVDELEPLLRCDGVHLQPRQAAITDLWAMSRSRLLVASGFSTFGMWASFLGGMPTLYAPGKLQQRVQAGRPGAFELELGGGDDIPEAALVHLRSPSSIAPA
jgi:hypothetical protein